MRLALEETFVHLLSPGFMGRVVGIPDAGRTPDHAARLEPEHLIQILVAVDDMSVLEQADAHGHSVHDGLLFGMCPAQRFRQIGQLAGALVHQFSEVMAQALELLSGFLAFGDVA